jgi:hypothetical protein
MSRPVGAEQVTPFVYRARAPRALRAQNKDYRAPGRDGAEYRRKAAEDAKARRKKKKEAEQLGQKKMLQLQEQIRSLLASRATGRTAVEPMGVVPAPDPSGEQLSTDTSGEQLGTDPSVEQLGAKQTSTTFWEIWNGKRIVKRPDVLPGENHSRKREVNAKNAENAHDHQYIKKPSPWPQMKTIADVCIFEETLRVATRLNTYCDLSAFTAQETPLIERLFARFYLATAAAALRLWETAQNEDCGHVPESDILDTLQFPSKHSGEVLESLKQRFLQIVCKRKVPNDPFTIGKGVLRELAATWENIIISGTQQTVL